jgi:hypothetical protein
MKSIFLMKEIAVNSPEISLVSAMSGWWQQLAYRNKAAEWSLYFMFLSGVVLWNQIDIPWSLERVFLVIHVLSSLLLFPLMVLPFWLTHRKLLRSSNKKLLKVTGVLLDYLLFGCALSGVFLVLEGNRGDDLGWLIYMVHLVSAFVILPLLIRHTAKWSVLKPVWSIFLRNNNV